MSLLPGLRQAVAADFPAVVDFRAHGASESLGDFENPILAEALLLARLNARD